MKKYLVGIIILFCVALAIVIIMTQTKKEPEEIRIGMVLPLTGNVAAAGEMAKRGIDLAIKEINNEGGVSGKKIIAIYEDSQGNPKDGAFAIQRLISLYRVPAVIGEILSSVTLAIAPIAEKNRTILISPASSNPQIREAGDYIFRIWPSDTFEGKIMANFIFGEKELNKVAVFYSTDDYGIGIKEVFIKEFNKLGGEVIIVESYNEGESDFRTQLAKIKETQSQAIYLVGHYKEMALILRQAEELSIKFQFFSVSAFEVPELLILADEAAEGVIYAVPTYDPNNKEDESTRSFIYNFREMYDEIPGIIEAHSYDAMKILAYALEKSDFSREKIKDMLYQIKEYPGITGQITFDEKGDVLKPLRIKIVKNKSFVDYKN